MKEALKQISDLVERFERNIEAYHSPAYNETQLRREFIDPLFEDLGWDVTNKAGYAEQYKDVIHEDAIKIAGATKAPDYYWGEQELPTKRYDYNVRSTPPTTKSTLWFMSCIV